MEFLLRPKDPAFDDPKVPYVAKERYDGSDFLSYPMRHGWPLGPPTKKPWDNISTHAYFLLRDGKPTVEQEQFFQTWAYFGLLSEILGGNTVDGVPTNEKAEYAGDLGVSSRAKILDNIYESFIYQDGEKCYVTTEKLIPILEAMRSSLSSDPAQRTAKALRLASCLNFIWPLLSVQRLPSDFSPGIRLSIAALGDFATNIINIGLFNMGLADKRLPLVWSNDYFYPDLRKFMMAKGWCPSDIARAADKYKSLQSLHLIQLLDRSRPFRDHTRCNEFVCVAGQIDMGRYQVAHCVSDCDCQLLAVNMKSIIDILDQEGKIPLLRLTGQGDYLEIEIVESGPGKEYVALSHVWADGLGNPFENMLHHCQLSHLRDKVAQITSEDPSLSQTSGNSVLVWLDTICCPVRPLPAKRKAIERIREVYQHAKHVLVLDSGLESYSAKEMHVSEQLLRIFTSGWMRRLWTLQEGALGPSLYFRFADGALHLEALLQEAFQLSRRQTRIHSFIRDILDENLRLRCFFHIQKGLVPSLAWLDRTLQHRSVTVLADEPLCITTLMSLDIKRTMMDDHLVLNDEHVDEKMGHNTIELLHLRMRRVWEQLAEKFGGIPAQILFVEGVKLSQKGWNWAPETLLRSRNGYHDLSARMVYLADKQLAQPTDNGLQIRWPGFTLELATHEDGRPRNPWIGLPRVAESYVSFKDSQGTWYQISSRTKEYMFRSMTREEQQAYNDKNLHPLDNLGHSPNCAIIIGNSLENTAVSSGLMGRIVKRIVGKIYQGSGSEPSQCLVENTEDITSDDSVTSDLKGTETPNLDIGSTNDPKQVDLREAFNYKGEPIKPLASGETGLVLEREIDVLVHRLPPAHAQFFDTLERLAMQIRGHDLTDKLLAMGEEETEERNAVVTELKQVMKDDMKEALESDQVVWDAVTTYLGEGMQEHVWVQIADWFNHDYIATRLPEDQTWIVG